MVKEITDIEDVKFLVNTFYDKIRVDSLLGGIFNAILEGKWDKHLPIMYRFWQTVLLKEHTYQGSPFRPHAKLPVEKAHFDRWLSLWHETLDENFEGEGVVLAKKQAGVMAEMFMHKINYYRNDPSAFIL